MDSETDPISINSNKVESNTDQLENTEDLLYTEVNTDLDGAAGNDDDIDNRNDGNYKENDDNHKDNYGHYNDNDDNRKDNEDNANDDNDDNVNNDDTNDQAVLQQSSDHEYKLLEKYIKDQNKMCEDLKVEIQKLESRKACLTRSEKDYLKNMHNDLEREMLKLQDLINEAINFQNERCKRQYGEFSLVTTFDEDNLNDTFRIYENLQKKTCNVHKRSENFRAPAGESSELNASSSCKESQVSVSDKEKLMKGILDALKDIKMKEKEKEQKHAIPCKEKKSLEKIKNKLKYMQEKICKLTEELDKKENSICNHNSNWKSCSNHSTPSIDTTMLCKQMGKADNYQQLKGDYLYLLTEFNKKDDQLKDLIKRVKNSCSKCAGEGNATSADESELYLLRNRVNEMKEEQVEFKCLMKEQALQLDEYRNKYLTAQQKVEEQSALIERLNVNNKCIEKQINEEVKEIRAKFQERLSDLLKYPKLLENEQLKLAQTCKEKEDLETKLAIVCKELKTLKSKMQNKNEEDCKPQLNKCQLELTQVKKEMEETKKQRDMVCEQLRATLEDLNTLRSESAKIIARTKERAEFMKKQQQDQIYCLEKKLAQCRAAASLSVTDRESVIKEMQGQLNTLSYSFDAAQKQIKTLRNHIAFMSNEKSFPVKC